MKARLAERARIVLGRLEGKPIGGVAASLRVSPDTVIDSRRRFEREGMAEYYRILFVGGYPS